MFRTVAAHPQELLCRYCMCRLWYVLIRPAGTTFEEVLPQADTDLPMSRSRNDYLTTMTFGFPKFFRLPGDTTYSVVVFSVFKLTVFVLDGRILVPVTYY